MTTREQRIFKRNQTKEIRVKEKRRKSKETKKITINDPELKLKKVRKYEKKWVNRINLENIKRIIIIK